MIDAIDWAPECQRPEQMQEVLVEDNQGHLRICRYYSIEVLSGPVEFWILNERRETEVPPECVVRWQPILRISGEWNTAQDCGQASSYESESRGPFSESEFYDLYELHRSDVIGVLESDQ